MSGMKTGCMILGDKKVKNEQPTLKGEVSIKEKMLSQTNPELRKNQTEIAINNSFTTQRLNIGDGNSSLCFKAEVSLPYM